MTQQPAATNTINWYGVRVRSKLEQITSAALAAKDYEVFLPRVRTRRGWSDRVKEIDAPLFPGYVFCRFRPAERVSVLDSPGVVSVVGFGNQPASIPDEEIEAVRAMLRSSLPIFPHPFLMSGQKIRIDRGPLAGAEGIIVEVKKQFRLVASVSVFQRSVSVELEREWVRPLASGSVFHN
jgi:transcription antitermination factor NusG